MNGVSAVITLLYNLALWLEQMLDQKKVSVLGQLLFVMNAVSREARSGLGCQNGLTSCVVVTSHFGSVLKKLLSGKHS